MHQCPACDSPAYVFIGAMGNRDHFRCSSCGVNYSHYNTEEELENSEASEDFKDSWRFGATDDGEALASAGFGTDEDYGLFSVFDDY